PEVTAKALRMGHRILEVPIEYTPRTLSEGKKIRARDGIEAILVLLRFRLMPADRMFRGSGSRIVPTRWIISQGGRSPQVTRRRKDAVLV
ncbi:MAG: hypothetical protein ACREJC_13590, partial [Tepidisphaeraceae bacterium]